MLQSKETNTKGLANSALRDVTALASSPLQQKVCELREWLLRTGCPHDLCLARALLWLAFTSSRLVPQTEAPVAERVLEHATWFHRNTEQFRLKGTFGGQLVQPALFKQGHLELTAWDHAENISKYEYSKTFPDNLLFTLTVKEVFMFKQNVPYFSFYFTLKKIIIIQK